MSLTLNIKNLGEGLTPSYGSEFAAGMDLYSPIDTIILSGKQILIPLDISISWSGPDETNYYARIAPRSGMCFKNNVSPTAGVIDYDYRGNVGVLLHNYGLNDFEIKRGDRIAQLIFEKINRVEHIFKVEEHPIQTSRGDGGFGSTGK